MNDLSRQQWNPNECFLNCERKFSEFIDQSKCFVTPTTGRRSLVVSLLVEYYCWDCTDDVELSSVFQTERIRRSVTKCERSGFLLPAAGSSETKEQRSVELVNDFKPTGPLT